MVGGDFNEIMQDIDRRSLRTGNVCKQSVNSLKSFIKTNKLIDVWRIYNENRQQFTWRRKDKTQASRIDMILLGKDFFSHVQGCKIKLAGIQYTDHQSVVLTFRSGVSEKGRGYWKINNSVIHEYDYKQLINKVIDKYLIQYHNNKIDIRLLWEAMKVEIREVTTMYCKNKSKLTRELRHKLESELEQKNIMVRDNQSEENDNLNKVIHNIEIELVKIYDQKAKGAHIRCREKWVEYGEKNNSYFLGLGKQRQIKKSINKLIDENNDIITDQMHILSTIKSYYEKLYTTKYPDENLTSNYIFDTKLENRLQDQDQSICDGKVTEEECSNAINNMKSNKAPGLDGLTVEFYREFWGKVFFF